MKILVAILTHEGTQSHADACIKTWVKDIQNPHEYYFYGSKTQSEKMPKTWNCEPDDGEARFRLPEKTYKMLVESLKHEWDFLFKCDDDTFVDFSNLVKLLEKYDPKTDLYLGRKIVNPFLYAQGGAGYVLTRSAVKKCIESLKHFYKDIVLEDRLRAKTRHAEDYSVGLALYEQKIYLTNNDLLWCPHPPEAWENQSVCIDDIIKNNKITTHYVEPHTMEKIYNDINQNSLGESK